MFEVGKSSAIDGISSEPRKAKTSSFTIIWLEQRCGRASPVSVPPMVNSKVEEKENGSDG